MKFECVLLVVSFENVPLTNTKHLLSFSFSFSVLRNVIPMIPVSEGSQLTDHRNLRRISIICLDWSGYVRGFMREVDTRILISHWCHNAAEYLYNRYICQFISHSHTFHLTHRLACADNYCTIYVTLYHKTCHLGQIFKIELWFSERACHKLSNGSKIMEIG